MVEARKRVLSQEHPYTLSSMGSLASTYYNQGKYAEAEELQVQAMEKKRRRLLGQEHPSTLISTASLVSTYRSQGRWKEAEELEVQLMETWKEVLDPKPIDTLASMHTLANTDTLVSMLGPNPIDTLASMHNLASGWKSQGYSEKAIELMAKCTSWRTKLLGEDHPDPKQSLQLLNEWRAKSSRL